MPSHLLFFSRMCLGISTIENKQPSHEFPSPNEKNNVSNTYIQYSRHSSLDRHNKDFIFSKFMLWRYERDRQVDITSTNTTKNPMPIHLGRIQRGQQHKLFCGGKKKKIKQTRKGYGHHLVTQNRDQHVFLQGDRSSVVLVVRIRRPVLTGEHKSSRWQNANARDGWLPVKLNKNGHSTEPTEEGSE